MGLDLHRELTSTVVFKTRVDFVTAKQSFRRFSALPRVRPMRAACTHYTDTWHSRVAKRKDCWNPANPIGWQGQRREGTSCTTKRWMLLMRIASPAQAPPLGRLRKSYCCTRRQTRNRTHPRRPVRCRLPRRHLRLGGISRRHHLGTAVRLSPFLLGGTAV